MSVATERTELAQMRWRDSAYFFLFAVSGFAGIIYESIWTHYLKLFLGHAAYAQTLVLGIFMGGMAIGAWVVARRSAAWRNLLRAYALIELLIGLAGLLFHELFVGVQHFSYTTVLPALDSPVQVQAYKLAVAALLILPQSILLGMTFPLMAGGIMRLTPQTTGKSLASLYFCNSFGASIGVLVSGFLLIAWVGLPGTIMTAALLNVLLALLIWMLARDEALAALGQSGAQAVDGPLKNALMPLCLLVAMMTGAASFYYEMAWIRMLSLVLGASTHAFELMLSAFILGLSLGGLWIRKRIDLIGNPIRFLAIVQFLMALFAVGSLLFYGEMFRLMQFLLQALERNLPGYVLYNFFSHLLAMLLMLPATFCAGMTLPLLTNILIQGGHQEKSIGAVYSLNTLGAIIAVVSAVHLTIPVLGLKGTILFGAIVDVLAGIALLCHIRRRAQGVREVIAACLICLPPILLVAAFYSLDPRKLASGVYRADRAEIPQSARMVYYRDGKTASVSLYESADGVRSISTNGKVDAAIQVDPDAPPTLDESTMVLAAALPVAFHPAATRVANIGIGSALTTHAVLANSALQSVDTIEIERTMVEAARLYGPIVSRAFEDPRSRIHIDDAKSFMANHDAQYDIIISEPSNPWVSGVSSLFTDEFYQNIRTRLGPGGVFVQWLQIYEFDLDLTFSVLKALANNFNDFQVFNANSGDLLIVAKAEGVLGTPNFDALMKLGFRAHLQRIGIHAPVDLAVRRIAGAAVLRQLVAASPVPMNSDYFPFVDLHAGRARFLNQPVQFSELREFPLPALALLGPPSERAGNLFGARQNAYLGRTVYAYRAQLALLFLATRESKYFEHAEERLQMPMLLFAQESCDAAIAERVWLEAGFVLAQRTAAYLSVPDQQKLWAHVLTHPCRPAWSAELVAWMRLFQAVGRQDAVAMRQHSRLLLDMKRSTLKPDTEMQRYAYLAQALALLATGAMPEARALLARIPQQDRGEIGVRLLFAYAQDG